MSEQRRGIGAGEHPTIPVPVIPDEDDFFSPFNSPWGENLYHPCPLVGEFPVGNRGIGERAL